MKSLNQRAALSKVAMLAALGAGCSATLPPLPENTSEPVRTAPKDEGTDSFAGLSAQDIIDQPGLAPHLTSYWAMVRGSPGCLGGQKVEGGLERLLYEYVLTPGQAAPELMIEGMVTGLIEAGASREDALDTVSAAIGRGFLSFQDMDVALITMQQLRNALPQQHQSSAATPQTSGALSFQDGAPSAVLTPTTDQAHKTGQTRLPLGGFGISWISSDNDPLDHDSERFRGLEMPHYRLFMLDGDTFVAPLCHISIFEDESANKGRARNIRVTGKREIWSEQDLDTRVSSEEFNIEELLSGDKPSFVFLPVTLSAVKNRIGESFVSRIKFTIDEMIDGLPPGSYSDEVWARLDPIQRKGFEGFKVTALGPQGRKLTYPDVAHPLIIGTFSEVGFKKESLRKTVQSSQDQRQRTNSLIGSQLTKLEMAHTPEAKGTTSLDIPQTGRAVVIAGASWCGPCRALDPLVKDYSEHLGAIGSTTKVYKVSIEDDRVQDGTVSDPLFTEEFPSGVLSSQQQKDLSISSVPRFFIVEDGKIVKQGILSAEELRDLKGSEK